MNPAPVTFEDLAAAQQRLSDALASLKNWQVETDAAARNLIDLLSRFRPSIGAAEARQLADLTNQVQQSTAALSRAVGENADPTGPAGGGST